VSATFLAPIDRGAPRPGTSLGRLLGSLTLALLGLAAGFATGQDRYLIGLNTTESLPHRVVLIDRHAVPARGDLVAFRFEGDDANRHGRTFVKVLLGLPGDEVRQRSRQFVVVERGDVPADVSADVSAAAPADAPTATQLDAQASQHASVQVDLRPAPPRIEHFAGQAKTIARDGRPLLPGPTGVIPSGRFHVYAPHPDSLDSRYAITGWIRHDQIIGKAYALF
jgi:conjugal transfer pilin signal peptidase TrbI